MPPSHSQDPLPFRLGDVEVFPTLHRLSGPAGDRTLEPKAMAVLVRLAQASGAVCSTQNLLDDVWQGEAVSEEVVRRAVYHLRKALGDDPKSPRYLETIPRSGYRLLPPIQPLPSTAPTDEAPPEPSGIPSRVWIPIALFLFLALALLVLLRLPTVSTSSEVNASPTDLLLLTSRPGVEDQPALSPDGSRVAYVERGEARGKLKVRLVDTESELLLAEDAFHPTWSPQGDRLAFLRRSEGRCRVATVPALGGPERILVDLGPCAADGLHWSPDGRWLVVAASQGRDRPLRLQRLELESLTLEDLTSPPPEMDDHRPAFSPDGQQVAFLRQSFRGTTDLYVVPVEGGEPRRLTTSGQTLTDVAWEFGGQALLFAAYQNGDHRLFRRPLTDQPNQTLVSTATGVAEVSTATGSSRLALAQVKVDFDFHHLDLRNGAVRPMEALSSTRFDGEIALSPNGERLAFASTRSGHFEIWVSQVDGRQPTRLTAHGGPFTGQPRWSPDGGRVVYVSAAGGDLDLYSIDVRGGLPEALTHHPAQDHAPSFSADSKSSQLQY